jgi:hypothetical protein
MPGMVFGASAAVYGDSIVPAAEVGPSMGVLMPDSHYLASGGLPTTVDDHFFRRYRELLDAEDHAFDELEHAYEDGDRAHFESDLVNWRSATERRLLFLERHGIAASPLAL